MKKITFLLFFVPTLCLSQNSQEDVVKSSNPENAFDFWIGDWDLSWIGPDSSIIHGINKIEAEFEGRVLQEHFKDTSRNFLGTSISVFSRMDSTWHQAWADNQGGYYEFIGEIKEGIRIFKMPKADVSGATYRMTFTDIKEDSFIWKWQGIREDWEEWKTVWEIKYVRAK